MVDQLSDQRLSAILTSVGEHLVLPPDPDIEQAGRRTDPSARRTRRLLAAAAIVAIVAGATLLIPSTRTAVADLLGIGSTRIDIGGERQAEDRSLPSIVEDLTPISVAEGATILGTDLPDASATALGNPDAIYSMPEGGVLLAWNGGDATLWVTPGSADSEALQTKLVSSGEDIERIDRLGTAALYIDGTHILQTPHRRLSADSVLLWTDGEREYRLESNMARNDAIDFGRALT